MTKEALAEEILASFTEEEWKMLENGTIPVPVSNYNRKILLGLKNRNTAFEGHVREEDVRSLLDALQVFLAQTWAEQPDAHKYVIGACLALTFIKEVPMHPQEIVRYTETVENGVKRYHCPAKGDSVICRYCVTEAVERRTGPSFG
ncbi:MAG: DUF2115 family protein [Blautia sp.]|nr:DUF2115 family protein [Blautia sp.]